MLKHNQILNWLVQDLIMLEHEKQKTLTIEKSLVNLTQGYLNPLYIEPYFDYVDQVNFSPSPRPSSLLIALH